VYGEGTEELVLDVNEMGCVGDEIDISILNAFLKFNSL
jgi:hypothetical protein